MRHEQHRGACALEGAEGLDQGAVASFVEIGVRFVKDHECRIPVNRARQSDALLLAQRDALGVQRDFGLVAIGQPEDQLVNTRQLGSVDCCCAVDVPEAGDVLGNRSGKQLHLLWQVGKHVDRQGYDAILVDVAEVERLLHRPEAKGLSIELFAKTAGLRPAAAMKLVRGGHIPTTQGVNPKTKAVQRFLTTEDIEAFHTRFVTLRRLAAVLGLSWQALHVLLADTGIKPATPDGQDVGALYDWATIETGFCCRWPKRIREKAEPS